MITTGLRPEIRCTWNLIVRPELEFEKINVQDFDALAISGGFEKAGFYEDAYDERLLNLIREFNKEGKIIASICVSALPVGKSGVLKGRKARDSYSSIFPISLYSFIFTTHLQNSTTRRVKL